MHPQVEQLLKIPQFEQRSKEWFQQRNNAITASDIPTVLNENVYKSPYTLLLDKCNGNPKPFVGNDATRWGNHYEDIAIEKYSQIKNKEVLSFGLIIHRDYPWLGGSPDGITTDGILLEVKCPLKRKIIHGEVPHHYLSQVLLNLEICDLEVAHFIEFVPGNSDDNFEINIVEVLRDREWFKEKVVVMKEFWDSVLYYRANGIDKHPRYKEKTSKKVTEGITLNIGNKSPLFINDTDQD
uniref:YqaJ viral recombinase domain-containing protein n=1 Tax=viral metagenome TaxID=1070528 RepID=A0A6C0I9L0_9ZZZZ